jgi:transposase
VRKNSKLQAGVAEVTVGIDLGDKVSRYCMLEEGGVVMEEGFFHMTESSLEKHFGKMPPARMAMEAGTRARWLRDLLVGYGHEVIIANSREMAERKRHRKNDRNDAERLARKARLDVQELHPVQLRSSEQQQDLVAIRVRDGLLRSRTLLVNLARSVAKEAGYRLPASITASFGIRSRQRLPEAVASALASVLSSIDQLSRQIEEADAQLEQVAREKYPDTQYLRSVAGVGTLTALTYVLTLSSPERFRRSRDVGAYLGLRPAQQQSGESDPQLGISKEGNGYLRRLLVQCAHHILGRWGKDSRLRQWGLAMAARGGKNAKKRAVVAIARKLAVLLHRLWRDRQYYQPFFGQSVS